MSRPIDQAGMATKNHNNHLASIVDLPRASLSAEALAKADRRLVGLLSRMKYFCVFCGQLNSLPVGIAAPA
jgi:hypothetical protein